MIALAEHVSDLALIDGLAARGMKIRIQRHEARSIWTPLSGPQSAAVNTDADELFYGGAAGGGKTDLLLGLAGTKQWSSIIFRRVFPSLRGIVERSREIFNATGAAHAKDSYNESLHIWRLGTGRTIEFGAIQYEHDKEAYRGRPHDFYGWDEVTEFTESQYRFVNTWSRSTRPGQRCRIVATGNPPTAADGEWVIRYWAPWLDSQHPNPARPGELRWFARIDNKDVELEHGDVFEHKGEQIRPRSRTFIPANLSDNPILESTGYGAVIQALPEPLRSQLLYGDFTIGVKDDPWQVIPTEWVRLAQERWQKCADSANTLTSIGADIARGGDDRTVLAPLRGTYFDTLRKFPGAMTPNGPMVAALIVETIGDSRARINLDVIGIGASVFDNLAATDLDVSGINFGEGSNATDRSGRLRFANKRAECYWKFREALDPSNGSDLALPIDAELMADLCSPRWSLRNARIYIESKDEIRKRLGRSPDCADAVVLALHGNDGGIGYDYIDVSRGDDD